MRKVIMNLAVSLDGFIEGPNGEYDWCFNDQDYGMEAFYSHTDTMFIGRKSFEVIRADLNLFPVPNIYVFSDTVTPLAGENIQVVSKAEFDTVVNEVLNSPGGDIWLFGGAELITEMMNRRLVTEMLLAVHPVVLGGGKPLFNGIKQRVDLTLLDSKTYDTGLVQLRYTLSPKFDLSQLHLLG